MVQFGSLSVTDYAQAAAIGLAACPQVAAEHRDHWDALWLHDSAPSRSLLRRLTRRLFRHNSPYQYFLQDWLSRHISLRGISLLEIGGTGGQARVLRRLLADYTLLDYSRQAIETARKALAGRPRVSCVLGDMFEWQPDKPYDMVLSAGLIEHFTPEEQEAAVRAHARLSSRYVCIGAPADTPRNWWRHFRNDRTREIPWQRPMDEKRLLELSRAAGLVPVAMTRLDPGYAGSQGRLRHVLRVLRATFWPNRNWGIDRQDGGLVFMLAEKPGV